MLRKTFNFKRAKSDLCLAIDQLITDISEGKSMKVYRQMKMYNDEDLNPILYKKINIENF